MKILLISSSPRKEKSQTFFLAGEVERACRDSAKTEIIHLRDHRIEFCRHCESCHRKTMSCPIDDDIPAILEKMLLADGIILASPNYINQITASMKALFERASHFIHCKRLMGKYAAAVVTSGSGQDEDVLKYIRYCGHICGAQYSGGVSSCMTTVKDRVPEAVKLGNKLVSDIKERKIYDDQAKIIERGREYFKKIILARRDDWVGEYRYWVDKGWL